jgi:ubiquinone/menaquinone biosynthesis C-methylase UbiE
MALLMKVNPALYRILTVSLSYDIPLYQELALQYGSPILELGAGLGRISVPLVRELHRVIALDNSSEMIHELNHARQHLTKEFKDNLHIIEEDMTSFSLDEKCGLIIIPLRTIQLLSDEQRQSCLSRCFANLHQGGALAIHLGIFEKSKADSLWRGTWEGPCTDGFLEVDELLKYSPLTSCYQLRHRVHQFDLTGQQIAQWRVSHDLTDLSESDLCQELAEVGFSDLSVKAMVGQDIMLVATP